MTNLLALLLLAASPQAADTAVVCPAEFRAALNPWLEYRGLQGHRIAVISNLPSAEEIRAELRRVAEGGRLRYVLLVGDADPAAKANAALRRRTVPTHHAQAVVNVKFGSEPEIASDNFYADLDDDRVPDVAVGRLTADSAAELTRIVDRILAYERSRDFGSWRRQIHFVAGLGGFGALADSVLEAAAKSLITQGVPPAYCTSMTYGSWQSPYCPDPRDFRRVAVDRLNEGSLFWVYIGHGQQRSLDQIYVPGGAFPIFSTADAGRLACRHGAPIACFLSCYTGAFDQPRDCLAEEMLRSPGGPVGILCGSRVTMPYAMAVMGTELLHEYFVGQPETLGDAILSAKQRTVKAKGGGQRIVLDAIAGMLSGTKADLAAERAEHLDLFNLIGDPLLRLPRAEAVNVKAPRLATAGDELEISGSSPIEGTCVVELVVRRDRLTFEPPARDRLDQATLAAYGEIYQRANEPRLASVRATLDDGSFATKIKVPDDARGPCHVRVFVEGLESCAAGAADIRIEAPGTTARKP